jgi:hypothetical protein
MRFVYSKEPDASSFMVELPKSWGEPRNSFGANVDKRILSVHGFTFHRAVGLWRIDSFHKKTNFAKTIR